MYLTMGQLGQGPDQNAQQSWWNWFFSGSSAPPPPTAYQQHEASFNQQQAGAVPDANAAWGGEAYDAPADEDLNPFAEQGYDAAEALGRLPRSLSDVGSWAASLADDTTAPAASASAPTPAPAPAPALPAPPAPTALAFPTPPAPVRSRRPHGSGNNKTPMLIAASLAIGGVLGLAYGSMAAPSPGRRPNPKKRKN